MLRCGDQILAPAAHACLRPAGRSRPVQQTYAADLCSRPVQQTYAADLCSRRRALILHVPATPSHIHTPHTHRMQAPTPSNATSSILSPAARRTSPARHHSSSAPCTSWHRSQAAQELLQQQRPAPRPWPWPRPTSGPVTWSTLQPTTWAPLSWRRRRWRWPATMAHRWAGLHQPSAAPGLHQPSAATASASRWGVISGWRCHAACCSAHACIMFCACLHHAAWHCWRCGDDAGMHMVICRNTAGLHAVAQCLHIGRSAVLASH